MRLCLAVTDFEHLVHSRAGYVRRAKIIEIGTEHVVRRVIPAGDTVIFFLYRYEFTDRHTDETGKLAFIFVRFGKSRKVNADYKIRALFFAYVGRNRIGIRTVVITFPVDFRSEERRVGKECL